MSKKKFLIISGSIVLLGVVIIIIMLMTNKKVVTYNVSFETNGGSLVALQTINEGERVSKPSDPTKEGFSFLEWQLNGMTYDFSLEVTSDLVLVAKWMENIEENVEKIVVKFETDSDVIIPDQIIIKGSNILKPEDPKKTGYVFSGWYLEDEIFDFETLVEEDIILEAKWEKVKETNTNNKPATPTAKKYTVTFNSNGGSAVGSQNVTEGNKVNKPNAPTRNGFTFVEWQLNGKAYDFSSKVTGNITLVAKWNENQKVNYTVTFNSNGGSVVLSQTVVEGNKVQKPSDPTRSGYDFGGWLLNNNAYDFGSAVNGNITLVAKWNQKSYTITAAKVDAYSPDSILSVFENGNKITVQSIKYSDGTYLCSGTNTTVNTGDIAGETSFIVVLSNGTQVNATLK